MSIKQLFQSNFTFGLISIVLFIIMDLVWVYTPHGAWDMSLHLVPYEACIFFILVYHVYIYKKNEDWAAEMCGASKGKRFDFWSCAILGYCYPYFLTAMYTGLVYLQHT